MHILPTYTNSNLLGVSNGMVPEAQNVTGSVKRSHMADHPNSTYLESCNLIYKLVLL